MFTVKRLCSWGSSLAFSGRVRQAGVLLATALAICAGAAAQSAPAADKPIVISDQEVRGAARFHVEPEYPPTARQFRVSGEVIAELTVGVDGKVENISIMKGNPLLNAAVLAALRKWTFTPFSVDGRPTRVKSTLTFQFKL